MQRGSDKHSAKLDEEMKDEIRSMLSGPPVEARAQEHLEKEGPGEEDPVPDGRLSGQRNLGVEDVPSSDQLEARHELARHLNDVSWPADRAELLEKLARFHAPEPVLDRLRTLPEDERYDNVAEVWAALGGDVERREHM